MASDVEPQRVRVTYTARRKCYVLRWTEQGRRRERKSKAKARHEAVREAFQLEDELARTLPETEWDAFQERFEREQNKGRPNYNWRAFVSRIKKECDLVNVSDIDASVISKAIARMREEGRPDTTIRGYLDHFMPSLEWAKEIGIINEVPVVRMPKKSKGGDKMMRSRPVTGEEFDRLIEAVPKVKRDPEPWVRLLNVLFWGGLRIGEAARLSAEWSADFAIMLEHDPPVFCISSEGQKSRRNQLLPVAPELVMYLRSLPRIPEKGRLLRDLPTRVDSMIDAVREIGQKSGIVVNADGKTVTAHDLRRSFGTRWAKELSPADLKELMRHRSISTTMAYYVDIDASELAKKLWRVSQKGGAIGGAANQPTSKLPKNAGKTSGG